MFDFVHERKRVVQVVLALIIVPFAMWGIDAYRNAGREEVLAIVNGKKIGLQEFQEALEQQRQRIRGMVGEGLDPAFLERPEIKRSVLDGLVTQQVLVDEAEEAGLLPTDEQIAEIIAGIEVFQKDGRFDRERYEAALKARNMTSQYFETRVRQDIAVRLMTETYAQNGYASHAVAGHLVRLNEQQRVIAVARFTPDVYLEEVQLGEADVRNYYEQYTDEFRLPERANVEYVIFSADALKPTIKVSESDIKQYFDEHASELGTPEQRQAAHILIAVDKQASEAEKQAARAKAEDVLKQVRQNPAGFAALAKQYSQDPGSARNGGDLGLFGRGMMVKPFEEAVFGMKTGEVSGLVETEFGYHIIKLLAIKPASVPTLSSVRGMIEERLKTQRAQDRFAELAEQFSNTVYEQSDTLKPAAELANTSVQKGGWLSRGQAPGGIWTDKVLQAVFSEEVLKNGRNTAAIEIAPDTLFAARVVEYKPATTPSLTEVATDVRQKLLRQRAVKLANKQGADILAALQRGEKVSVNWQPAQSVSRNQRTAFPPVLIEAVFRSDVSKLPAYVGVAVGDDYWLARIDAVKEAKDVDEAKRSEFAQQLRRLIGEELLMAYLGDARQRANISVKGFPEDGR